MKSLESLDLYVCCVCSSTLSLLVSRGIVLAEDGSLSFARSAYWAEGYSGDVPNITGSSSAVICAQQSIVPTMAC